MNPVFLSASVPYDKPDVPGNDAYVKKADPVAIRDAVIALLEVVLPRTELYFGGHPAITPMVRRVAERRKLLDRVKNYQSAWFLEEFPADNDYFPHLIVTRRGDSLTDSLRIMRNRMLRMLAPGDADDHPPKRPFSAAFFIGGMKGIKDELGLFREIHGDAPPCFPIASTGGASRDLLDDAPGPWRGPLLSDSNYVPLFRSLLNIK